MTLSGGMVATEGTAERLREKRKSMPPAWR